MKWEKPLLYLSHVDRAKGDAQNVLDAIIEKTDDGFYKVGTKRGIVNTFFSRNQLQECKENLININDIPNIELSLREVSTKDSKVL